MLFFGLLHGFSQYVQENVELLPRLGQCTKTWSFLITLDTVCYIYEGYCVYSYVCSV
jgi:hypothetical protein